MQETKIREINIAQAFKYKVALFLVFLLPFKASCMIGQENFDPQRQAFSLKRKHIGEQDTKFSNLKRYKRSHDDQLYNLSVLSPYVKGEFCAQIRWVNDLNTYYGNKTPEKKVQVPATIHRNLAFVGNHLKACYELSHSRPTPTNKNILVPFMSFIGKRENNDREFFRGDYLRLGEDREALAFISGPDSSTLEEKYQKYAQHWNDIAKVNFLPSIQMVGGDTASQLTGKNFDQINIECDEKGKAAAYHFHSEEWFHEILRVHPQLVINPIMETLSPGDKLCAIVFDMYSFWDVCNHCQQNFKKALFQRETIKNFESILTEENIRYPRNGLKIVFRVSSEKPYYSDVNYQHIKKAGGGYEEEEGFDVKTVNTAQVSLCTRPFPTYEGIHSKVKNYFPSNPSLESKASFKTMNSRGNNS